jgi:hypothetical protein
MRKNWILLPLIAVLTVAPVVAGAQNMGRAAMPTTPSTKEFASYSTAAALLDERKGLKITADEVTALTSLQAAITERNSDLVARYDSARRSHSVQTAALSAGDGRKTAVSVSRSTESMPVSQDAPVLTDGLRVMMRVSAELLDRNVRDAKASVALLDAARQEAAAKVLDKQRKDMLKRLPLPAAEDKK